MKQWIVGIDVGFSGGLCKMSLDGSVLNVCRMPTVETEVGNELDYFKLMDFFSDVECAFVEKQQFMIKRGPNGPIYGSGVSMFKFGGQYYALRAIITLSKVKVTYVAPQTWKKYMLPDMDKKDKSCSIARAKQLFPHHNCVTGLKKSDDGLAEAVLIAEFGRRISSGPIHPDYSEEGGE